jgi:hypothetical protein
MRFLFYRASAGNKHMRLRKKNSCADRVRDGTDTKKAEKETEMARTEERLDCFISRRVLQLSSGREGKQ